jgi:type III secretion system FlhB-like substrate exporter
VRSDAAAIRANPADPGQPRARAHQSGAYYGPASYAIALKIREVAEEHRIPVVQNPPLARALHGTVEIDREIPPEHYQHVAEVIGYVMRLNRAVAGGR